MVFALPHVMCFNKLFGEETGVVDPAAVDVADVDGSVGTGGEVDGAAPFVGTAEELRSVAGACCFQARSVRLDFVASDELARGIRNKDVVAQFGHELSAIDAEAGAGGVGAGVGIRGGVGDLQRINAGLSAGRGDVLMHLCDAGMWIAQHGLVRHDGEHEGVAVRAVEMVAPVVERAAILAFAAGGRDLAGAGIPFEIAAGDVDDVSWLVGRIDLACIKAVVEVNTAVGSPTRGTDLELSVLGIEAVDERFDFISLAVAIGVLQKKNLRAGGGDQSAIVWEESLHVVHVIGKSDSLVHASVPIFISEQLDA